ncbi:hypothetical protein JCM6882_003329 [Rhodosporidiobolus microsporus]
MGSALSAAVLPASSPSRASSGPYEPRYDDVLDVLDTLMTTCGLPVELAILILDDAEYHPVVRDENRRSVLVQAGWQGHQQNETLFITDPIPAFPTAPEQPVQRVELWTESRDQGFSSFAQHHGTRENSSSWFELVLLRPDRPQTSPAPSPTASRPSSPSAPVASSSPASSPSSASAPLPGSFPSPRQSRGRTERVDRATPLQEEAEEPTYSAARTLRLHSNIHASRTFALFSASLLPYVPPPLPPPSPAPAVDDDALPAADPPPPPIDLVEAAAFVADLRPRDRIALVALAQYPMWVNAVRGCGIRVEVKAV